MDHSDSQTDLRNSSFIFRQTLGRNVCHSYFCSAAASTYSEEASLLSALRHVAVETDGACPLDRWAEQLVGARSRGRLYLIVSRGRHVDALRREILLQRH